MKRVYGWLAAGMVLLSFGAAQAQGVATGDNGMTLYSFDKDAGGKSACYDDCAAKWPPYLAQEGETKPEGWTMVERTDGSRQWALNGKPAYYFAGDKKAGDMAGDGVGGVWHALGQ